MKIKNWYLQIWNDNSVVANGKVFDNSRFPDGYFIHTSRINSCEVTDSALSLITYSGSNYILDFDEVNYNPEIIEKTKTSLSALNSSSDFLEKAIASSKKKEQTFIKSLDKELLNGDLYLELMESGFDHVYFKYGDKVYNVPYHCHVGMIEDSFLYTIPEVVDFRHFEFKFDSVSTYHMSETIKRLIVKNTHTSPMQIDGISYPAGETTVTCVTEKNHLEGLFSPDCVNGKSLLQTPNRLKSKEE